MFTLDNKLLEELGLGAMPEGQKREFLQHVYEELEIRVGESLTAGMTDEQLDEFGYFADKDGDRMLCWLLNNVPGFEDDEEYRRMEAACPDLLDALSEYGAMSWLMINSPDYPSVVECEFEKIKGNITSGRDAILDSYK